VHSTFDCKGYTNDPVRALYDAVVTALSTTTTAKGTAKGTFDTAVTAYATAKDTLNTQDQMLAVRTADKTTADSAATIA